MEHGTYHMHLNLPTVQSAELGWFIDEEAKIIPTHLFLGAMN